MINTPRIGSIFVLGSVYLGAVVPDTPATQAIVADAHSERGSELLERGAFDEAAREFRAVLAALPDSAAAHNNLGVTLASMGRVDQAAEHFRQALAIEPDFEEARQSGAGRCSLESARHTCSSRRSDSLASTSRCRPLHSGQVQP
jgi:Tfp pilus assembly protein PilF